jgi:ribonuclease PH
VLDVETTNCATIQLTYRILKEKHMNLKAALTAATLALSLSSMTNAAVVDPTEPPATPAGGAPEAGITVAQGAGIAITIAVIAAIAGGGGNDSGTTTTTTSTTTTP